MFDIIYICTTQQLPTGIELIFLNFIRCKHVKSNYWFKGLCNNTCSNAIGQLCKIKSNLFCHSLIYRSVWTDAQRDAPPISERVGRCCFYEAYTPATLLARLQQRCVFHTVDSQRLATPSSRFSQENCLFIDPQCSFCPSAILGPNQGNPEYSIAGTGTVGKWYRQGVKDTIIQLLFTEHFLQGRTASQRWVLPRLLKLNSYKTAAGLYDGRSMPGTCSGYFQTSSCTGNRIPKHQAGGVKRELLFFKSFLLALSWLSFLPLSLLLIENTEFK